MAYIDGITVIIPTYNRAELLDKTLLSLCFQSSGRELFEVIVIDDGSSDATQKVVDLYRGRLNIHYYFQEDKGFRVARARNIGIENAQRKACLFLDSGILASTNLIQNHWLAYKNNKELVRIGYALGFDEFDQTSLSHSFQFNDQSELESLFKVLKSDSKFLDCRESSFAQLGLDIDSISIPWLLFWTCHVSCSTKSLLKVGGFDEHFESWGGEDVELGLRLHKLGLKFEIAENCDVIHCPHERSSSQNKRSSTQNCQYMYNKHPCNATYLLSQGNHGWESIVVSVLESEREEAYA